MFQCTQTNKLGPLLEDEMNNIAMAIRVYIICCVCFRSVYLKGFAPMPPAPLVWKCGCEVAKLRGVSENFGCQVAKWRWPPEASQGHRRPGGPPGQNSPKCGLL